MIARPVIDLSGPLATACAHGTVLVPNQRLKRHVVDAYNAIGQALLARKMGKGFQRITNYRTGIKKKGSYTAGATIGSYGAANVFAAVRRKANYWNFVANFAEHGMEGVTPTNSKFGSRGKPFKWKGNQFMSRALERRVDRVAPDHPAILLGHNPKAFLAAAKVGIPLTLAGHTHGGQVATKKRPGVNLAVAHRLSAGFYHRDRSTLFVTVGTGSWFPLRVHCPAEVVMLECRRGECDVREIPGDR